MHLDAFQKMESLRIINSNNIHLLSNGVILTGFNQYKTIVKSLISVEIEITEMMKRHQHITKLQSELIQGKRLIDVKLDEAIAKHCYLEKTEYQLLPQVVMLTIVSNVKINRS